jgi:hypothetical protein
MDYNEEPKGGEYVERQAEEGLGRTTHRDAYDRRPRGISSREAHRLIERRKGASRLCQASQLQSQESEVTQERGQKLGLFFQNSQELHVCI